MFTRSIVIFGSRRCLAWMIIRPISLFTFHRRLPNKVNRLLEEQGVPVSKPLVVLVPGTIWETKHWTIEGSAGVARQFLQDGFAVALAGIEPRSTAMPTNRRGSAWGHAIFLERQPPQIWPR